MAEGMYAITWEILDESNAKGASANGSLKALLASVTEITMKISKEWLHGRLLLTASLVAASSIPLVSTAETLPAKSFSSCALKSSFTSDAVKSAIKSTFFW